MHLRWNVRKGRALYVFDNVTRKLRTNCCRFNDKERLLGLHCYDLMISRCNDWFNDLRCCVVSSCIRVRLYEHYTVVRSKLGRLTRINRQRTNVSPTDAATLRAEATRRLVPLAAVRRLVASSRSIIVSCKRLTRCNNPRTIRYSRASVLLRDVNVCQDTVADRVKDSLITPSLVDVNHRIRVIVQRAVLINNRTRRFVP